jgi:hypothetical protein
MDVPQRCQLTAPLATSQLPPIKLLLLQLLLSHPLLLLSQLP